MGLEVVRATTEAGLASLDTLRAYVGLATSQTSDDAALTRSIARATAWAETYVGYPLLAAKYRETVAGRGSRRLMLARTPVRAVAALYYGTDTGDAATEQIPSTEFSVEAGPGFLARTLGWAWSVPVAEELSLRPDIGQEFEPWLVDYVAGFTLDGIAEGSALWSTEKGTTSTGRTLPGDIEDAALIKASNLYTRSDSVVSKSVGDLSISYGSRAGGGGASDLAAERLSGWRRTA